MFLQSHEFLKVIPGSGRSSKSVVNLRADARQLKCGSRLWKKPKFGFAAVSESLVVAQRQRKVVPAPEEALKVCLVWWAVPRSGGQRRARKSDSLLATAAILC